MESESWITYTLSTKDCHRVLFRKKIWFLIAFLVLFLLLIGDGLWMYFSIRENKSLIPSSLMDAVLAIACGVVWFFGRINGGIIPYGIIQARKMDQHCIEMKFENKAKKITYTKTIRIQDVYLFHGLVLIKETWKNYAFLTVEAAKELGLIE